MNDKVIIAPSSTSEFGFRQQIKYLKLLILREGLGEVWYLFLNEVIQSEGAKVSCQSVKSIL